MPLLEPEHTTEPTHVRVFSEGDGWAIDGADDNGRFTETVWKYDTQAEAISMIPAFIKDLTVHGEAKFIWRPQRG